MLYYVRYDAMHQHQYQKWRSMPPESRMMPKLTVIRLRPLSVVSKWLEKNKSESCSCYVRVRANLAYFYFRQGCLMHCILHHPKLRVVSVRVRVSLSVQYEYHDHDQMITMNVTRIRYFCNYC